MKFILSALAAVALLVGVAASQPAEARCFWNGFAMECYHSAPFGYCLGCPIKLHQSDMS